MNTTRIASTISLVVLAGCMSGCVTLDGFFAPPTRTIVLHAGESFSTSADPKVNAELFAMMAPLHTPEMDATIKRAQCEAQAELCK